MVLLANSTLDNLFNVNNLELMLPSNNNVEVHWYAAHGLFRSYEAKLIGIRAGHQK